MAEYDCRLIMPVLVEKAGHNQVRGCMRACVCTAGRRAGGRACVAAYAGALAVPASRCSRASSLQPPDGWMPLPVLL